QISPKSAWSPSITTVHYFSNNPPQGSVRRADSREKSGRPVGTSYLGNGSQKVSTGRFHGQWTKGVRRRSYIPQNIRTPIESSWRELSAKSPNDATVGVASR